MIDSNKDIQKDQIIETAREVFALNGYKKTTLEDIAHKAGKAKSSLYYYFKGKEELFLAVLTTEANLLSEQIRKEISTTEDICEQVKIYILTRMLAIRKLSNIYSALSDDILNTIYLSVNFRKEYDETERKFIKSLLDKGTKQGLFYDNIDTQFAANALVAALKGMEHLVTETEENQLKERIIVAVNILLFGLIRR